MSCQELGFLRSLLCKWSTQATLMGKSVLPVLLILRWLTLDAAMRTAWRDNEDFYCATNHSGCAEICLSELILVLAAGLVFLCYLIHLTDREAQTGVKGREVHGHALVAYLACMASVALVEAAFVTVQSSLHGVWVDTQHHCDICNVDCSISSAWEKTVFLVTMFTASCLSLLLSVVEIVCVLLRAKPWRRKADGGETLQQASGVEESRCFLRQLLALWHSHAGLLGKCILPVLQFSRLVIIGAAVRPVWINDSKDFICVGEQKCTQAIFNSLFPFSLFQYWTLQAFVVLASGLIFFSYLVHLIVTEEHTCTQTCVKAHGLGAYLGHLTAVILLEVGSAVGQAVIYGFSVDDVYAASETSCPHWVDCFVPKAKEKTVLMVLMFSVTCLSALLTLLEMGDVLKRQRSWRKHQSSKNSETSGFEMEEGGRNHRGHTDSH